jgi:hypothetical protein
MYALNSADKITFWIHHHISHTEGEGKQEIPRCSDGRYHAHHTLTPFQGIAGRYALSDA